MQSISFATVAVAASVATAGIAPQSVTFQQGVNGYAGTQDTYVINNFQSNDPRGALNNVNVDGTAPEQHGLVRFDGIFGAGAGQIPAGSTITSATLRIDIINIALTQDVATFRRMLADWDQDTLTWDNALLNGNAEAGIQIDGFEASTMLSGTFSPSPAGFIVLDVTADLQAWANGESNFGWAFFNEVDDSYGFSSSEDTTISERPLLSVSFVPSPGSAALAGIGCLVGFRRRR